MDWNRVKEIREVVEEAAPEGWKVGIAVAAKHPRFTVPVVIQAPCGCCDKIQLPNVSNETIREIFDAALKDQRRCMSDIHLMLHGKDE